MIIRITKTEELSVGQLYMYKDYAYSDLKRGYCVKIEPTKAEFSFSRWLNDDVNFKREDIYVACYDAGVFRKYEQLCEKHKKELDALLNPVDTHPKKTSWFKRLLKKEK